MIDWFGVFVSTLWICGLAVLLATIGIAYWTSGAQKKSLRQVLREPAFRLILTMGLGFFALGMALSVDTWWERLGWVVIMILLIGDGISVKRREI